jgi:hypothetical protein
MYSRVLHAMAIMLAAGSALLLDVPEAHAQQDSTRTSIAGVVGDAQSGAPLEGAIVAIPALRIRTITDERGRFLLVDVPPGQHRFLFRMLGYADWEEELEVGPAEYLRVGLLAQPIALQNIQVIVDRLEARRRTVPFSVVALTPAEVHATVAATAADVIVRRSPTPYRICPDMNPQRESATPEYVRATASAPTVLRLPPGGGIGEGGLCMEWRGRTVYPAIYLDESMSPITLEDLAAYSPEEIHTVEFFSSGTLVRVYTIRFVKSGKPLLPTGVMFRR